MYPSSKCLSTLSDETSTRKDEVNRHSTAPNSLGHHHFFFFVVSLFARWMSVNVLVCVWTETLRHFFGYQTSERICFEQKQNTDVSIEPYVQLIFILQN